MKILDANLKDGVHEWRDGKRFVKEGDKLYLEGTDTLAGRSVPSPSPTFHTIFTMNIIMQLRDAGQVRAQLLALHGLHARGGDQVCDIQPREVSVMCRHWCGSR